MNLRAAKAIPDKKVEEWILSLDLLSYLYDKNIKLWGEKILLKSNLYSGRLVAFEFARTRSRLQEMLA